MVYSCKEKDFYSHLMANHRLQRGVLVLQGGGGRPGALGHHLVLIVIDWQSVSHLLYVLPQRGDGLPYQQEDYQPGQCLLETNCSAGRERGTHKARSPKTQMPS